MSTAEARTPERAMMPCRHLVTVSWDLAHRVGHSEVVECHCGRVYHLVRAAGRIDATQLSQAEA